MKIINKTEVGLSAGEHLAVVKSYQLAPSISKDMHFRGTSLYLDDGCEVMKIETASDKFVIIKFDDVKNEIYLFYSLDDPTGVKYGLLNDGFSHRGVTNIHKFDVLKNSKLFLGPLPTQGFAFDYKSNGIDFKSDKFFDKFETYTEALLTAMNNAKGDN